MSAEYVPGRPPAALRGHVLRYLGYREHAAAPLRRRQPPSAGTALILGLHPLTLSGPAVATGSAAAFVGGLSDTWVLTEFTGPQAGVQVDLTPAATYTLLGGRALPGGTVPRLDELDDPVLAALPARLAAEPTWDGRFALVSALLADRLLDDRARLPAPEVRYAWDRLSATAGRVGVAELAAETGWSRRHLQSRFRSQVGLAPGTVRRVLRFARAAELVGGGRDPLALVAAECGYADQPHLSREFRALAGISPAAFRAEQFPFLHDAPPRPGQDRSS
ncbi:AraC family transcriptional regulator [Pseudonocardia sp. DR1-2]|uniref:helix-turn-helix domain-containing protein n=1 Tax=Pseudonocardia sp. DR1-2 TaxID=2951168 RepID=UPI0020444102|nr:AraC family transcriptional regulator [Pseudonocardia sp. DR1-2]MCM3844720.1 AraC family transcriptional regulator [Pseudonocardia sp. DR1-2]